MLDTPDLDSGEFTFSEMMCYLVLDAVVLDTPDLDSGEFTFSEMMLPSIAIGIKHDIIMPIIIKIIKAALKLLACFNCPPLLFRPFDEIFFLPCF